METSFDTDSVVLITKTSLYSLNVTTATPILKYTSFNLSPYNLTVVNTKYLYFQSLEGICLLNLRSVVYQSASQEILLQKTYNSTNQVQYDPRYERLMFFSDFETIEVIPLPHKNTVVPYGYNRIKGGKWLGQDEIVAACSVWGKNEEVLGVRVAKTYKRLLGVTANKAVVTWEYPTGQFIDKADHMLTSTVLDKNDNFFENTNIHTREHGKRYMMFYQAVQEQ